jgi:hypothetical protein
MPAINYHLTLPIVTNDGIILGQEGSVLKV